MVLAVTGLQDCLTDHNAHQEQTVLMLGLIVARLWE
jgi:hypothetical protein